MSFRETLTRTIHQVGFDIGVLPQHGLSDVGIERFETFIAEHEEFNQNPQKQGESLAMETKGVPVWFGTVNGEFIGRAEVKEHNRSTTISIEIQHPEHAHITNLITQELLGFATVIRPIEPEKLIRAEDIPNDAQGS